MVSLALTSLTAFLASLLLTAAVRSVARRWGIVDRPDGKRKLHGRTVPLWGGIAVYGATVLGLLAVRFSVGGALPDFSELSTAWIIAAGFVCFVGGIDDKFNLPARVKLALQIISVLPIVLLGYSVDRIVAFGCPIQLGWLGVPLTVLWLLGCINALNLIDGMDGLASIIGLSTAAMLGVIAASQGHPHVTAMAVVLAASLAGFLMYNLPPASIFLGDSGSMVIGLSLGLLGMQGTLKTSATLAITAPAVVMTLPMFDIIAAMVRRKLTGRRIDAPDRLHIHHRLLDRGWTPWQVLCLLGALCLTMGAAATAATIFRRDALALIAAMTLVVLMIRMRLFGYDEFVLAKEAADRTLRSYAKVLGRLLHLHGTSDSWHRVQDSTFSLDPVLNLEPQPLNASLWDKLLCSLREKNIRQVEFSSIFENQPRRIRWIDPAASLDQRCHWSLSVSLPGRKGEICELRAVSAEPITNVRSLVEISTILRTCGEHFAAHTGDLFGPPAVLEVPAIGRPHTDQQRKAA
jgi:UDP-GlcNAc:undecaprenyl-phosphate GlcNAc-1-phosphate transferase